MEDRHPWLVRPTGVLPVAKYEHDKPEAYRPGQAGCPEFQPLTRQHRRVAALLPGPAPVRARSGAIADLVYEDIAIFPVLVNKQAIAVGNFCAHLFEDAFAFEHDG